MSNKFVNDGLMKELSGKLHCLMQQFVLDFLTKVYPFGSTFEKDVKLAIEKFDNFVMNSLKVKEVVEDCLKTLELDIPIEIVLEYIARQVNVKGQFPKKRKDVKILGDFYFYLVKPSMDCKAYMVSQIGTNHPELSTVEKIVIQKSYFITQGFSQMFSGDEFPGGWWRRSVVPYRESEISPKEIKRLLLEAKKTNQYAVLSKDSPFTEESIQGSIELPLIKVFPKEIAFISKTISELLLELPKDEREYYFYFSALKDALNNSELEQMESLWSKVDTLWIQINENKRVIPVHGMEDGYQHPYCVTPEYSLRFRSGDFQDVLKKMKEMSKKFAYRICDKIGADKIDKTDALLYVELMHSNGDFIPTGQSIPNRAIVQKLGMKVFVANADWINMGLEKQKSFLKKALDPASLEWVLKHLTAKTACESIFGHEFGHCLLIREKLSEIFGKDKPLVEEAKATLFGFRMMSMAIHELPQGCHHSDWQEFWAYFVAQLIRMYPKEAYENETFSPYVNECMILTRFMEWEGYLSFDTNGKIVLATEALSHCKPADRLEAFVDKIIFFYESCDKKKMMEFVNEYANKNHETILAVYKAVNS